MLSTKHVPSPLRPNRIISLIFLGTALALGGTAAASAATTGPATSQSVAAGHHVAASQPLSTWNGIMHAAAGQRPGQPLPPAERLLPAAISGPQAYLPMTPAREANATTIVRQALGKHMGLRSAVIAVATAMQESTLLNLQYGTYDSLGLFQQQPDMGWGTPAQVTDPAYASDAFLDALQHYQASNPGWATQPLWEAAQGVQNSGFPYAYAKWEVQAAQIVANVARHLL